MSAALANEISFVEYLIDSLDVEHGPATTSQEFNLQAPYQNALVARVFYLKKPATPQQMQEILTVLRTVFGVRKVFNYTAQNAVAVRCDTDTMALVDKEFATL